MKSTTMREEFLEQLYLKMKENESIFFLTADFGAIALDKIRTDFKDRFINVGIAEQNLIGISAGLALEGWTVYAFAIAPFLSMRAYEQSRVNLSLLSSTRDINVNLIAVGAGLSYDMAGPTHQCLEDLSLMRVLPNFVLFSPSDNELTKQFVDYSIQVKKPKYLRLDGKPVQRNFTLDNPSQFDQGFRQLFSGSKICLISTGIMTQKAYDIVQKLKDENNISLGLVDMYLLKPYHQELLKQILASYSTLITLEEGFSAKGGLDTVISNLVLNDHQKIINLGLSDQYFFKNGTREELHQLYQIDDANIIKVIKNSL